MLVVDVLKENAAGMNSRIVDCLIVLHRVTHERVEIRIPVSPVAEQFVAGDEVQVVKKHFQR